MNLIANLLLIDDSEATNNFHKRLLGKLNFADTVSICRNGKEGLDFLANATQCPDLIFLDLNMPVLDGFEFLSMVHAPLEKIGSKKPLIVILTSSEESVDKDRCKHLYDNIEFCSKPLTIAQFKTIKSHLE
jgi:CheY-like chemotaxis protein